MEKITQEIVRDFFKNNSLKFKSSHHKLSLPIINRIYKKMINGIKFDDIKVCEDLIIDGHHRYISSLIAEFEIQASQCPKTSATVEYDWNDVQFTESEWDTDEKIQHLNKLDAKYNKISLDKIIEITK